MGTVFLLGGSGYVGTAYRRFFERQGIAFRSVSRVELNYAEPVALAAALREARADFLINAAGYTGKPNVDACELHKVECLFGNAVLPGLVAQACAAAGVAWGQVSSGCIYQGSRADGGGFTEEDRPNFSFRQDNCSFYSGSKALGEEVLRDAVECYVWRMRIPFNHEDGPRNYLSKLMRYERLVEVRNSISQLDEFVRATWECWQRRVPFGIYNVTNPGVVTTREVVELIRASGLVRKEFQFFASEAEFLHRAAKTPRSNCVLDSGKLAAAGISLTEVHDAIRQALRNWQPAAL